jgi:hypothetical protein
LVDDAGIAGLLSGARCFEAGDRGDDLGEGGGGVLCADTHLTTTQFGCGKISTITVAIRSKKDRESLWLMKSGLSSVGTLRAEPCCLAPLGAERVDGSEMMGAERLQSQKTKRKKIT